MRTHDRLFIDDTWVPPTTTDTLEVVNPHTEGIDGVKRLASTRTW